MCGKENPAEAEACQFCGAILPLTPAAAPPGNGSEDESWLGRLRRNSTEEPESGQGASSGEAPAEDWLERIRKRSAEDRASLFGAEEPEEKTPEWMQGLDGIGGGAEGEPAPEGEDEDWLARLQAAHPVPFSEPPAFTASESTDATKPPAFTTPEPQQQAGEDDETAEWLRSLESRQVSPAAGLLAEDEDETEGEASAIPPGEAGEQPPPTSEELPPPGPDWLTSPDSGSQPASPDAEIPDWLGSPPTSQTPAARPFSIGTGELPEWLGTGGSSDDETESTPPSTPRKERGLEDLGAGIAAAAMPIPGGADEDLPEWLASAQVPPSEGEDEDWFKNFVAGKIKQETDLSGGELPTPADDLSALPDWLGAETQPGKAESGIAAPGEKEPATPAEYLPDWLRTVEVQGPPTDLPTAPAFTFEGDKNGEAPSISPFASEDIPDWLTPAADDTSSEREGGVTLEPADLPGWLQAMRPIEAVAPLEITIEDDQQVVKAGPLAGLRGILPAEDYATHYRKPPVYSARLQATEKQRESAALLEHILAEEKRPRLAGTERTRAPRRLVRLVVGVLLILALLIPLLAGSASAPLPSLYAPAPLTQFHNILSALPQGAPVLLAVEFDPGFSGEMRYAAAPVLEQLVMAQARLALISSVATGPVLAQNLMDQALDNLARRYNQGDLHYLVENRIVNLGYLAGGVASLQEFASRPQQAARYGWNADPAAPSWDDPVLQGVGSLSDFRAVIVITDSPDTARAWVEQVQPVLGSTPLLVISSAQAAPLIQPYSASGQVQGMLSGLVGGVTYAQLAAPPGSGASYWNAYQVGLLIMIAFIVAGAALQFLTVLLARRKSKPGA